MSPPEHVLHVFPTFVAAGVQQRTLRLIEGLPGLRHSVVALDGRLSALDLLTAGEARAIAPPARRGPGGRARALRSLLRSEGPDLLCTYNWGSFDAVLAARSLPRLAHLHHEDGFNADEAQGQKRRRVVARRLLLRGARSVVVPSLELEGIARRVWRLPPGLVRRISNGVSLERFTPRRGAAQTEEGEEQGQRARLGIAADALVVGGVGHLRPVKRFDRLIRACARLPRERFAGGVQLVLLGDGEQRGELEALARENPPPGGAVHLVGHRDDLVPWYRAMDVFCISSDSEQQPISLLEAMACELPVAATDVGDVRACLPPEAAPLLCSTDGADTTGELARAIEALLADPGLRERLGRAGRERVREHHSIEAMLAAYGELYHEALGGHA